MEPFTKMVNGKKALAILAIKLLHKAYLLKYSVHIRLDTDQIKFCIF